MNASKTVAPKPTKVVKSSPSSAPAVSAKAPSRTTSPSPAPVARAVSPAPVVVAVAETSEGSDGEKTLQDELKSVQDQLTSIRDAANAALLALKRVAKRAAQDVKDARKKKKQPREEGEPRKLSNFEIPVTVSDELCTFFSVAKGTLLSRTEVNNRLRTFGKENNLTSGQKIFLQSSPELLGNGFKPAAAAALCRLLAIPETTEGLTIFNIQKYMGRHYLKAAPAKA